MTYIHFGPRSLRSILEGPKWPRFELTKDQIDSVTSSLGPDMYVHQRTNLESMYEDISYVTELQTVDCVANNNHTGRISCLLIRAIYFTFIPHLKFTC